MAGTTTGTRAADTRSVVRLNPITYPTALKSGGGTGGGDDDGRAGRRHKVSGPTQPYSQPYSIETQAVDPVAGTMTGTLAAATRSGGYVLVYGSLGSAESTIALKDLVYRGVTIKGFWRGTQDHT